MTRTDVSIGRLEARLAEYLDRVRAGEEVVITDRGRPVARLAPLEDLTARGSRLADLTRAGLVRAPTAPLDAAFLDRPRPSDPVGRSLRSVLEERAET